MEPAAFRESLTGDAPPAGVGSALEVLWWAEKGDWDRAHDIAQDMPDPDGAWLHAHLHREEGDLANARYWYRRAGRDMPDDSLADERARLLRRFLP